MKVMELSAVREWGRGSLAVGTRMRCMDPEHSRKCTNQVLPALVTQQPSTQYKMRGCALLQDC